MNTDSRTQKKGKSYAEAAEEDEKIFVVFLLLRLLRLLRLEVQQRRDGAAHELKQQATAAPARPPPGRSGRPRPHRSGACR